jgi:hypothetical protein
MKTSLLFGLMGLLCLSTQAQDSIIVEVGQRGKIIVIAKDRKTLKKMRTLNYYHLISKAIDKIDTNEVEPQTREYFSTDEGNDYFSMDANTEGDSFLDIAVNKKRKNDTISKKKSYKNRENSFWAVDLGVNNYLNANGSIPGSSNEGYRLRNLNSVYVGVGAYKRFVIGGKKSPFSIRTGVVFDWYNFKFQNPNYLVSTPNGVEWSNYNQDNPDRYFKKSKLVVSYFTIPFMFDFRFKDSKDKNAFKVSVGGYASYKLGSRTKVNYNGNEKDRESDTYYINNWRYGLEANVGYKNLLFFAKYDLTPLFDVGKGPELYPISFGIRL